VYAPIFLYIRSPHQPQHNIAKNITRKPQKPHRQAPETEQPAKRAKSHRQAQLKKARKHLSKQYFLKKTFAITKKILPLYPIMKKQISINYELSPFNNFHPKPIFN